MIICAFGKGGMKKNTKQWKWWVFTIFAFLIFIILVTFSWFFVLQPYQKERILTFLNPELDPLGGGYNQRQALIALGSGGLFGKGLGQGTQTTLGFLPSSKTDSIF